MIANRLDFLTESGRGVGRFGGRKEIYDMFVEEVNMLFFCLPCSLCAMDFRTYCCNHKTPDRNNAFLFLKSVYPSAVIKHARYHVWIPNGRPGHCNMYEWYDEQGKMINTEN